MAEKTNQEAISNRNMFATDLQPPIPSPPQRSARQIGHEKDLEMKRLLGGWWSDLRSAKNKRHWAPIKPEAEAVRVGSMAWVTARIQQLEQEWRVSTQLKRII